MIIINTRPISPISIDRSTLDHIRLRRPMPGMGERGPASYGKGKVNPSKFLALYDRLILA